MSSRETPEETERRWSVQRELARVLAEILPGPYYVEPAPVRDPAREPCVVFAFPRLSRMADESPVDILREGAEESGELVQPLYKAAGTSYGGVVIFPEDGLEWTIEAAPDRSSYLVRVRGESVRASLRLLVIDDGVLRGEVEADTADASTVSYIVNADWFDDAMRDGTALEIRLAP